MTIRRLCVYCGSSSGDRGDYAAAAGDLASLLLQRDIDLVYGGASRGIMGVLADAVLAGGGRAYGVIPESLLQREVAHEVLTEMHVTTTMHERKALMARMADGFVALPGGFGTLEEIVEILTWGQLNFHQKPCGILNVEGYFDALLAFIAHAENEGFVRPQHRQMLLVAGRPDELLQQFESYVPPQVEKWRD